MTTTSIAAQNLGLGPLGYSYDASSTLFAMLQPKPVSEHETVNHHTYLVNDIANQDTRMKIEEFSFDTNLKTTGYPKEPESCHCFNSDKGPGRKLVVCIDGTANKFGVEHTNVVKLYHSLIKDDHQLTYYNSGIGTFANLSYWRRLVQIIPDISDMAFAWNVDHIIIEAYRWLVENYKEGDVIYLFGFSRGAYQVRALAGMLEKVGLLHKGNDAQIPFAYELYTTLHNGSSETDASPKMAQNILALLLLAFHFVEAYLITLTLLVSPICLGRWVFSSAAKDVGLWSQFVHLFTYSVATSLILIVLAFTAPLPRTKLSFFASFRSVFVRFLRSLPEPMNWTTIWQFEEDLAENFKKTFAQSVQVHFVGCWDTVSSIGFLRRRTLPLADETKHVCYFRHALALDETRVKFLPEYAHGGITAPLTTRTMYVKSVSSKDLPHVKEVWFPGTHAQVGGSNWKSAGTHNDYASPSHQWMDNEAVGAGLELERLNKLPWKKDTESEKDSGVEVPVWPGMAPGWYFAEFLPSTRLTYEDKKSITRRPKLFGRRIMQAGQMLHFSALTSTIRFPDLDAAKHYVPAARFPEGTCPFSETSDAQSIEDAMAKMGIKIERYDFPE